MRNFQTNLNQFRNQFTSNSNQNNNNDKNNNRNQPFNGGFSLPQQLPPQPQLSVASQFSPSNSFNDQNDHINDSQQQYINNLPNSLAGIGNGGGIMGPPFNSQQFNNNQSPIQPPQIFGRDISKRYFYYF